VSHRSVASRPQSDDVTSVPEALVFSTGVQALVRAVLDQQRADRQDGLRTATFASGYQGSPLGTFDSELRSAIARDAELEVVLRPGVNEELGATAVWGSQLVQNLPGPRVDGVTGVWYGKAPGVDRAADAIRHGNFVGTSPTGGVVALCGDDPSCKSSTIPNASEQVLAAMHVPVLVAADVQDAYDLARHAILCSRASGLWTAVKVVTSVADGSGLVEVGPARVRATAPTLDWHGALYVHRPSSRLVAPDSLVMEETLTGVRAKLAKLYARENKLNAITRDGNDARIGIVAAGTTHQHVSAALRELGLEGTALLRVLRIGMVSPLDEEVVRAFADGLEEILVIEEKGPFLERLVKDCLYGTASAPRVVGRYDEAGEDLVPGTSNLDVDRVAHVIGRRVGRVAEIPSVRARLEAVDAVRSRALPMMDAVRTPFFCSGCPHNTSTEIDPDTIVGAGIGCHSLVLFAAGPHGRVEGLTQMGGDGSQWIGVAPFVDVPHFVQNMGDGTYHHSGSLSVRAAVAAGLPITFKLLYNDAVAMTGGQPVIGQLGVAELASTLMAEGVRRVVITTEDTGRYRDVRLPAGATVEPRARLMAVQRELAKEPGVTVLIHDQACATELRRARKRGTLPEPAQRVIINERVCEGCGDCGEKSGCLSVEPVETEFGRKTRIHQGSCNKDYSCLDGDCPSFLTIVADPQAEASKPRGPGVELPLPASRPASGETAIRMVGIGGTGVVSVSHALGVAARYDGKAFAGIDQTGLSQKAGPVLSDLRIADGPDVVTSPISAGGADVLIGFDVLTSATPANLAVCSPRRTVAVVSTSKFPTGEMVIRRDAPDIDTDAAVTAIRAVTRTDAGVPVDARAIAERLFGDHMQANNLLLGAAWQVGAIPLSLEAMRHALAARGGIEGPSVVAFEWGRACVARPDLVPETGAPPLASPVPAYVADLGLDAALEQTVARRVEDLTRWQSERVARRYVAELARVREVERRRTPGSTAVTASVAQALHKLMAYKDEYEVARLHLLGLADLPVGARVRFHLHPPLLRSLGLQRKLTFGRWFVPVFRGLRSARFLRGTPLDIFGYAAIRRLERALPAEYLGLVDQALERLTSETVAQVVEIADLADEIRGYEQIKLAGVSAFRERAQTLLTALNESPPPVLVATDN